MFSVISVMYSVFQSLRELKSPKIFISFGCFPRYFSSTYLGAYIFIDHVDNIISSNIRYLLSENFQKGLGMIR